MRDERAIRSVRMEQINTTRGRPDGVVGFKGYAAVYNQRAWIGPKRGGFWEEIAKGAFARAVAEDDVLFVANHDPSKLLARMSSGTLRLNDDRRGLAVDADIAPTPEGLGVATLLERGDLREMSFAFAVDDDDPEQVVWSKLKDGSYLRRLVNFERVWDVSVVAEPAYGGTEAALRACRAREADDLNTRLLAIRRRLEALKGA